MIILLLYVAKILTSHSEKNSFRFQAYKVVGNINGCAMKIQSKNNLREENEYLSFFKEKHIKCNSDETAYITMNEKKGLISVITCKKTSKDIKFCESNMYTE